MSDISLKTGTEWGGILRQQTIRGEKELLGIPDAAMARYVRLSVFDHEAETSAGIGLDYEQVQALRDFLDEILNRD